jgi:hypothetical protein
MNFDLCLNAGDKVITTTCCLDHITPNTIYTIKEVGYDYLVVTNDIGLIASYEESDFINANLYYVMMMYITVLKTIENT